MEQAAHIVRSQKETTRTLEPAKGYKRGQIKELIKFANTNYLWISPTDLKVEFFSKEGENEVYTGDNNDIVVKLNNLEYAGNDTENFFCIAAHNKPFGNVPYQMTGLHITTPPTHQSICTQKIEGSLPCPLYFELYLLITKLLIQQLHHSRIRFTAGLFQGSGRKHMV